MLLLISHHIKTYLLLLYNPSAVVYAPPLVSYVGVLACKLFWLGRILSFEAWEWRLGHEGLSNRRADRSCEFACGPRAGTGNLLSAWEPVRESWSAGFPACSGPKALLDSAGASVGRAAWEEGNWSNPGRKEWACGAAAAWQRWAGVGGLGTQTDPYGLDILLTVWTHTKTNVEQNIHLRDTAWNSEIYCNE